jgi:hypothetical protein
MKITGNEAAAPFTQLFKDGSLNTQNTGLTIRQEFAARAMHGLMANPSFTNSPGDDIAAIAVQMANDLIVELNKKKHP